MRAAVFAALGDETRLAVLGKLLSGEPQSIARLTLGTNLSRQAVTKHLRVLADAGLVAVRPEGRARFYRGLPERLGALRPWLESTWDDALYRLKLAAELEAARRGPRPRPTSRERNTRARSRPSSGNTGGRK